MVGSDGEGHAWPAGQSVHDVLMLKLNVPLAQATGLVWTSEKKQREREEEIKKRLEEERGTG